MIRRATFPTAAAVLLVLCAVPVAHVATVLPAAAQTGAAPGIAPDTTMAVEARVTLAAIDAVVGRGSVPVAPVIDEDDLPGGGAPRLPAPGLPAPGPPADGSADRRVPASASGIGWSVLIEHTGPTAWDRIEVIADVHGALGSRSALRAALAGGVVPAAVQRINVSGPSGPIAPGDVLRIDGVVPLASSALTGADSAVHPLRLRVLADGRLVGGIDTAIVRLGATPVTTLATSLVWPLSAPPLRDPTGDPATALDPLTVVGGRFDTLLSALAPIIARGTADTRLQGLARGVALVIPAHLLEDLERRSAGVSAGVAEGAPLDDASSPGSSEASDEAAQRAAVLLHRIRSTALALPAGPVVSPYGDADVSRLLASGTALRPIAARAMLEGERRIDALLGRPAGAGILLAAPLVPAVLDLLPDAPALVPYSAIEAPDLALDIPLSEPVRTLRSPTGRTVVALVADPYLTEALGRSTREQPSDPVLAAHEVLIRTAMVHLEAPGREGRGLLMLPPPGFDPDPRFAVELLARVAHAPWLAPAAPSAVVAAARAQGDRARIAPGQVEPLPARLVSALAATARDLELLSGAADAPPDGAGPTLPVGDRSFAEAGDELMRATSTALTGDLDAALALLAGVRSGVDLSFGTITIVVDDVILTDRDGTVPLTLTHAGGVPLRVRVTVSSSAALTWTDGPEREVPLGVDTEHSVEIPVRSGATGRFPVTITVTDPTGERVLASDTVGVRATAIAGPALALIILTIGMLIVYGTARQRRRGVAWQAHGAVDAREVT